MLVFQSGHLLKELTGTLSSESRGIWFGIWLLFPPMLLRSPQKSHCSRSPITQRLVTIYCKNLIWIFNCMNEFFWLPFFKKKKTHGCRFFNGHWRLSVCGQFELSEECSYCAVRCWLSLLDSGGRAKASFRMMCSCVSLIWGRGTAFKSLVGVAVWCTVTG